MSSWVYTHIKIIIMQYCDNNFIYNTLNETNMSIENDSAYLK